MDCLVVCFLMSLPIRYHDLGKNLHIIIEFPFYFTVYGYIYSFVYTFPFLLLLIL